MTQKEKRKKVKYPTRGLPAVAIEGSGVKEWVYICIASNFPLCRPHGNPASPYLPPPAEVVTIARARYVHFSSHDYVFDSGSETFSFDFFKPNLWSRDDFLPT